MFIIVFLIYSASVSLSSSETDNFEFIIYETDNEILVVLKDKDNWIDCSKVNISGILNEQVIQRFSKAGIQTHKTSNSDISRLSQECDDLYSSKNNSDSPNNLIVPGTKWCGVGNKAKHDLDYGILRKTDECCQKRDKCYLQIKTGETKYGVLNLNPLTIKDCECDQEVRECLSKLNCSSAFFVGTLFFTVFEAKCLNCSKPIIPPLGESREQYECHLQDQDPYDECFTIVNKTEKFQKIPLYSSAYQNQPYKIPFLFTVFSTIVIFNYRLTRFTVIITKYYTLL